MKNLIILFFFLSLTSINQAATYKVEIDYAHPKLTYTDTKSGIVLNYFDQFSKQIKQEFTPGIFPISQKAKVFTLNYNGKLKNIEIRTQGNDAFFIDQIKIWKDGRLIKHYGEEAQTGWCLSTDYNDSFGGWKGQLKENCKAILSFMVENPFEDAHIINGPGTDASMPSRRPRQDEESWVYENIEAHQEINAEGLGRCYDIRYLDPINWSNESLESGQRASVIQLIRDNSKRPARHNNKDYVIPKGVQFTSEIIGDSEAQSKFAATSFEFENEVLQEYRADVGVPKVGSAQASAAFRDVNAASSSQSSLYVFSKMYKQFYKLDLYFDDPAHQQYIDTRFWVAVKELGQGLSAQDFIRKMGTHYASTTYYGGNFFQRRTVQQSAYGYYESNESEFKADVEGTIKKVKFDVGTTQGKVNRRGDTEQVEMSAAKIFTIGGDLNQYRPDQWAATVINNLAVVKVQLTRISDLLTSENFPDIPSIRAKQELLEQAILDAEKEAQRLLSQAQKSDFFTKKAAKFKLTVTHMKCISHGSKEAGTNSEYFGKLTMGMFNRNGKKIKSRTFFNRESKNQLDMSVNQSKNIKQSITYTIQPADIQNGFVSIYGKLEEKDLANIPLSNYASNDKVTQLSFRSALFQKASKRVSFTNKYGDHVQVFFELKKI